MEFFDYECPFCKASEPAIKAVRHKYPNKVSIVYEDFPLTSIHPYAFEASIAAQQNAFMSYHDSLFANQNQLGSFSYVQLADRTGVKNIAEFQQCVKGQKTAEIVQASKSMGDSLGVRGTPTFIINDKLV